MNLKLLSREDLRGRFILMNSDTQIPDDIVKKNFVLYEKTKDEMVTAYNINFFRCIGELGKGIFVEKDDEGFIWLKRVEPYKTLASWEDRMVSYLVYGGDRGYQISQRFIKHFIDTEKAYEMDKVIGYVYGQDKLTTFERRYME